MNSIIFGASDNRTRIDAPHMTPAIRMPFATTTGAPACRPPAGRFLRCIASGLALLSVAGCASEPAQTKPAVAAQPPPTQAEGKILASALESETRNQAANMVSGVGGPPAQADDKMALTLAKARELGYRIVDRNGETVYCHEESATGSHLRKGTVCLTQKQWDNVSQNSARAVEKMQRNTFPCPTSAKNGGCGG